jgi:2-enoate reductase
VNPQTAREVEKILEAVPTNKMKNVMIIGGGVAGCEAGRVLKLRGHEPEIFEASPQLGGNLNVAGVPSFKKDELALSKWYQETLKALGVMVKLRNRVELKDVKNYDAVIVATGGTEQTMHFGDDAHTYSAAQVLGGTGDLGDDVVVLGGGLAGCEVALWLREKGKCVTVVEESDKFLEDGPSCYANKGMLGKLLNFKGVIIRPSQKVVSFEHGVVKLESGGELKADSLIVTTGRTEDNTLYDEIKANTTAEVYKVGDCQKLGNIQGAIWGGFEVASRI